MEPSQRVAKSRANRKAAGMLRVELFLFPAEKEQVQKLYARLVRNRKPA